VPDLVHLKRAYESVFTQKHFFIGRDSLPDERVVDKLPCCTFFADHFGANVTMARFQRSLNQENKRFTYCKYDMLDLMLFEGKRFLNIIKSQIEILIKDGELAPVLTKHSRIKFRWF
jgi:hypothetical protein